MPSEQRPDSQGGTSPGGNAGTSDRATATRRGALLACGSLVSLHLAGGVRGSPTGGHQRGSGSVRQQAEWTQTQLLTARDEYDTDTAIFGTSASMTRQYALVGTQTTEESTLPDSARLFEFDGSEWSPVSTLTTDDPDADSLFGWSVAFDGSTALVAAPQDARQTEVAGAVYRFDYDDDRWSSGQRLTAESPVDGAQFGYSISMSGEHVVVGAPGKNDTGRAALFRVTPDGWVRRAQFAPESPAASGFGSSVAIDGDSAVVWTSAIDDSDEPLGAVTVFERVGDEWRRQNRFITDESPVSTPDKSALAIDAGRVIVAYRTTNGENGANTIVQAYHQTQAGWRDEQHLTIDDLSTYLSPAVAVDANWAAVGLPTIPDSNDGAVHFLEYDGSEWALQDTATPTEATGTFGYMVALSGDRALVGFSGDSVYAFESPDAGAQSTTDSTSTVRVRAPSEEPIADADVALYTDEHSLVAEQSSDGDGRAEFSLSESQASQVASTEALHFLVDGEPWFDAYTSVGDDTTFDFTLRNELLYGPVVAWTDSGLPLGVLSVWRSVASDDGSGVLHVEVTNTGFGLFRSTNHVIGATHDLRSGMFAVTFPEDSILVDYGDSDDVDVGEFEGTEVLVHHTPPQSTTTTDPDRAAVLRTYHPTETDLPQHQIPAVRGDYTPVTSSDRENADLTAEAQSRIIGTLPLVGTTVHWASTINWALGDPLSSFDREVSIGGPVPTVNPNESDTVTLGWQSTNPSVAFGESSVVFRMPFERDEADSVTLTVQAEWHFDGPPAGHVTFQRQVQLDLQPAD